MLNFVQADLLDPLAKGKLEVVDTKALVKASGSESTQLPLHARMLEAAPDKDSKYCGMTQLIVACQNGQLGCAGLLLQSRVDPNRAAGASPLGVACLGGHLALARLLLEAAALPDREFEDDQDKRTTPLREAAASGHTPVVTLLLEARADTECRSLSEPNVELVGEDDEYNFYLRKARPVTPLAAAIKGGHTDVVSVLVMAGAKLYGLESPIMEACRHGRLEILRLLLAAGADVNKALQG